MDGAADESTAYHARRVRLAVAAGIAVAAIVVSVFGATGEGPHGGLGLPDAGGFIAYGLPLTRVLTELAAVVTVGLLLMSGPLSPRGARAERLGRYEHDVVSRATRWAAACAAVWALGALAMVPLSLADLFGHPVPEILTARHLFSIAPQLPFIAAWGVSALVAVVVAVMGVLAQSLSSARTACLTAIVGLLPVAATGHSATGASVDVTTDALMLHVAAISVWIGGVVALLFLAARPGPIATLSVAATRFSRLALICWIVTAGSGLVNLAVRVPISAWWTSNYGGLAMGKVAALVLLGGLGLLHRRWSLPQLERGARALLLRWGVAEVVIMAGTLGLAVALGRTAPPPPDADAGSIAVDRLGYELGGPPTAVRVAFDGRVDLLWAAAAAAAALGYLMILRRATRAGVRWPAGRAVAWLLGCALLAVTTSSGIQRYAPAVFSVFVLQTMLLWLVVPMLLVLGALPRLVAQERGGPAAGDAIRSDRGGLRRATFRLAGLATGMTLPPVLMFSGAYATVLDLHWGRDLISSLMLGCGLLVFHIALSARVALRRWMWLLIIVVSHLVGGLYLAEEQDAIAATWFQQLRLPWGLDLLYDQRVTALMVWWSAQIPLIVLVGIQARATWRAERHREQEIISPTGALA